MKNALAFLLAFLGLGLVGGGLWLVSIHDVISAVLLFVTGVCLVFSGVELLRLSIE